MLRERNYVELNGVFYTPELVSQALVNQCAKILTKSNVSVLEPSVGDGSFLLALRECGIGYDTVDALDLDKNTLSYLQSAFRKDLNKLKFLHRNFISFANTTNQKYDLIIGNPPFIGKHQFTESFKESVKNLSLSINYAEKDIKNSWAAFLLAGNNLLSEEGVMAFVLCPAPILCTSLI